MKERPYRFLFYLYNNKLFFCWRAAISIKSRKSKNLGSLRKNYDVRKWYDFVAKQFGFLTLKETGSNLGAKDYERSLEFRGDRLLSTYWNVLLDKTDVTLRKNGLRTIKHHATTYGQTRKDCLVVNRSWLSEVTECTPILSTYRNSVHKRLFQQSWKMFFCCCFRFHIRQKGFGNFE